MDAGIESALPALTGWDSSNDRDMTQIANDKPARPPAKAGKGERAFDTWLKQGLHKLYDDIAGEPVPDALLKMIRDDREK